MGRAIAAILGSSEAAQYRSFGRPFAAIGDTIAAFWQELIRDAAPPSGRGLLEVVEPQLRLPSRSLVRRNYDLPICHDSDLLTRPSSPLCVEQEGSKSLRRLRLFALVTYAQYFYD